MSLDIPVSHDTSLYLRQQISRQNFSSEVVSFIESEYKTSTKVLLQSPEFIRKLNLFHPKDFLGRAWFTLHSELKHIDDSKSDVLPIHARTGFAFLRTALYGLWVEDQILQRESGVPIINNIPISKSEIKDMTLLFNPYRNRVRRSLAKDSSIRSVVGYLIKTIKQEGETAFDSLKSDANQYKRTVKEFTIGVDLAHKRWLEMTTQA